MFPANEHDPFSGPDQRYRRAEWLRSNGRYARRGRDDAYTLQVKRFLDALDRCKDEFDEERLARRMPGLFYARRMRLREESHDRWSVEARVLARQDHKAIAHRVGTSPEVVFWYEKAFFDVRDRLDRRDWVVHRVLGPAAHRGILERDYDLLLKLYALVGGPLVVDALVEMNSREGGWVADRRHLQGFWADDGSDTLKRKAAIAARCLPVNPHTQGLILEAHHKLLEIEKSAADGRGPEITLLANIQEALEAVPFHTASARRAPALVAAYDHGAAELRADELQAAALGVDPVPGGLALYRIPDVTTQEAAQPAGGS